MFELTEAMKAAGLRRMPVVNSDGALSDIVTLDDLNRLLANEHDNITEVIEAESPPY